MMTTTVYANAIAKYDEGKLLDRSALERIANADYPDAVRMLADYGFWKGRADANTFDPDKAVTMETNELISFVTENAYSDAVAAALTARFYYGNAKALYKGKFVTVDYGSALYSIAPEMRSAIEDGNYEELRPRLVAALNLLDGEENPAPRTIDQVLSEAAYADALDAATASRDKTLIKYIRSEIDLTNILTVFRAKRRGFKQEDIAEMLIGGGELEKEKLLLALDADEETLEELFGETPYFESMQLAAKNSLAEFVSDKDGFLYAISARARDDMMSISPFLSYYTQKLFELKTVKTILTLIKNDRRDELKRRLPALLREP